jgi:hypothetical protein
MRYAWLRLPGSWFMATLSTLAGSHPLTAQSTVVGRFRYMAPEQVEGKQADARYFIPMVPEASCRTAPYSESTSSIWHRVAFRFKPTRDFFGQ